MCFLVKQKNLTHTGRGLASCLVYLHFDSFQAVLATWQLTNLEIAAKAFKEQVQMARLFGPGSVIFLTGYLISKSCFHHPPHPSHT